MRSLSRTDLADIVEGAGLFGSGGGGSVRGARQMLEAAPDAVRVVDVDDVLDGGACAVPACIGAPTTMGGATAVPAAAAFRELAAWAASSGRAPLTAVMPGELGAVNTLVACLVAAELDLPVIDADGAGRSIPELTMATFAAEGVSLDPTFLVSRDGQTATIHPPDASHAEHLARPVVERFGGMAGFATWYMDAASVARAAPIRGTLELARGVGALLRTTEDPVASVVAHLSDRGARELVRGRITALSEHEAGGFDFGRIEITGANGQVIHVDAENENLVARGGDDVLAALPDLLCMMTTAGSPFSHADLDEVRDEEIALITLRCDPALRSAALMPVFAEALQRVGT